MKYHLRIYDNFHYQDESEAYNSGDFDTYEEAVQEAKAIVIKSLEHNWSRGMNPEVLIAQHCLYGDDPIILPAVYPEVHPFKGIEFVSEIAPAICSKLEQEAKKTEVQTLYQDAIRYATQKHQENKQTVKGTRLPYVVHLSNVAMEIFMAAQHTKEFNLTYAIQVAMLHDTIEDTATKFEDLKENFGEDIAYAVQALSKDGQLPKSEQINDSIQRIKKLPKEVWAVKLADRITNLQPPPKSWTDKKRRSYILDSQIILEELKNGNQYLAERLEKKISEYRNRCKKHLLDKF
jgi:guanosine-3',5'-bis(diphosphate) 3'-pyrophosphohydrolase